MHAKSHYPGVRKNNIEKEHRERNEERAEQEAAEQGISLSYTPRSFLKLRSINLETAFELAKSLSEEKYDFVKKLAPMGK